MEWQFKPLAILGTRAIGSSALVMGCALGMFSVKIKISEGKICCKNENVNSVYNPYPTAFPYGNGMVLHFYQQQESSTTKTVHKIINKGLKAYV